MQPQPHHYHHVILHHTQSTIATIESVQSPDPQFHAPVETSKNEHSPVPAHDRIQSVSRDVYTADRRDPQDRTVSAFRTRRFSCPTCEGRPRIVAGSERQEGWVLAARVVGIGVRDRDPRGSYTTYRVGVRIACGLAQSGPPLLILLPPPHRLSITEWKPVTGTLPPLLHDDWMDNFSKYKDSPEYRILNPNMTLDEYKFIYFMEWSHRLWGRVIGLTFVLPAIYFTARRRVTPKTALKLLGISGMIGFQGFIGWWMVKSGLQDDLFAKPGSHPRVSQYRLTAHLGAAFTVYAAMLWCGLDILRENRLLNKPADALAHMKSLNVPQLQVFRGLVGLLVAMVFTTAMTGGLVAGLDAGLIYNEFPKMGTGYMPPMKEMMDPFYSHTADGSDLWWRNLLENPTIVQFQHRVMALSTFTAIMAIFAFSRFNPRVAAALPKTVRAGMMGVVHLASFQVLLGISTLVYMVPTHLAAAHQAGALALLTGSIVLGHRVWLPRTAARIAAQRIEAAAMKGAAGRK